MSKCIICGGFASTPPYCQLCCMGKIGHAENSKYFKEAVADRHRIPGPDVFPKHWHAAVELRVADLFKTKSGLPGHWKQIQNEVSRTNKGSIMIKDGKVTKLGKILFRRLGYSIIAAAKDANFDFSELVLIFPGKFEWLKIKKKDMKLSENWSKGAHPHDDSRWNR